jgi:hypothetical protein
MISESDILHALVQAMSKESGDETAKDLQNLRAKLMDNIYASTPFATIKKALTNNQPFIQLFDLHIVEFSGNFTLRTGKSERGYYLKAIHLYVDHFRVFENGVTKHYTYGN